MRRLVPWAVAVVLAVMTAVAPPGHAARRQPMTVFAPAGPGRHPAVLFVHGGAWQRGRPKPAELAFAAALSRQTGWVVGVPSYSTAQPRRVGEERDVHAALVALAARSDVDPGRMVLWGESAGGQLALLEAFRHPRAGPAHVRAVVSISGPTDLVTEYGSGGQIFLDAVEHFEQMSPVVAAARDDSRYRSTSPVFHVGGHTPPTFQAVATGDPLVPAGQVAELSRALSRHGVVHRTVYVPGRSHAASLEHDRCTPLGPTVADLAVAFAAAQLR